MDTSETTVGQINWGASDGNNEVVSNISTQNRYQSLNNTNMADNMADGEQNTSESNIITVNRKRARASTGDFTDQNINYEALTTDEKLSVMFKKMNNIGEKVDDCLNLHKFVHGLKVTVSDHDRRLKVLEYKSIDIEARSRRNNLLFGGISELRGEDCFIRITELIQQHLYIETCPPVIRAHRLGKYKHGSVRPIIACFLDYRDTVYVLNNANKLKGTAYSINKNVPKEMASARSRLWPEYKRLKQSNPGSKVAIVYPARLIIDGRTVGDEFPDWNLFVNSNRVARNPQWYADDNSYDTSQHRDARAHSGLSSDDQSRSRMNVDSHNPKRYADDNCTDSSQQRDARANSSLSSYNQSRSRINPDSGRAYPLQQDYARGRDSSSNKKDSVIQGPSFPRSRSLAPTNKVQHKSRRTQSPSPNPNRERNHTPLGQRIPVSSHSDFNSIQRPWTDDPQENVFSNPNHASN